MKTKEEGNIIIVEGFNGSFEEDIKKLSEIVSQNSIICALPTLLGWTSKTNNNVDTFRTKDFILICKPKTYEQPE